MANWPMRAAKVKGALSLVGRDLDCVEFDWPSRYLLIGTEPAHVVILGRRG